MTVFLKFYIALLFYSFITISIIFYNFPILINILHTTPIYYDDIEIIESFEKKVYNDANYIDIKKRYRLQNIFSLVTFA